MFVIGKHDVECVEIHHSFCFFVVILFAVDHFILGGLMLPSFDDDIDVNLSNDHSEIKVSQRPYPHNGPIAV